jgi:hypothetical protein
MNLTIQLIKAEVEALIEWHTEKQEECASNREYLSAQDHYVRATALRTISRAPGLVAEEAAERKIEAAEAGEEVKTHAEVMLEGWQREVENPAEPAPVIGLKEKLDSLPRKAVCLSGNNVWLLCNDGCRFWLKPGASNPLLDREWHWCLEYKHDDTINSVRLAELMFNSLG